jgi:hypothetical protein
MITTLCQRADIHSMRWTLQRQPGAPTLLNRAYFQPLPEIFHPLRNGNLGASFKRDAIYINSGCPELKS